MFSGGCHCGNLRFQVESDIDPSGFNPRECDCQFCLKHGVQYFSDNNGSLVFSIGDEVQMSRYQTGDCLAEFLVCSHCGVMVGLTLNWDGNTYGAVNCRVMDGELSWGDAVTISPRQLSREEKVNRWIEVWFKNVAFTRSSLQKGKQEPEI